MILFSIALLQISNLFQWDSNPIMGLDKICADILIIVLCCFMINKMESSQEQDLKRRNY